MHKVRIVAGRVGSSGAVCSRRFDDPVSLKAHVDFFTIMSIWGAPVVIQKGDFTDTAVSFDLRQRGAKPTFNTGLEFNIFRRVCMWIADYRLDILITRDLFSAATGNNDDRGCR